MARKESNNFNKEFRQTLEQKLCPAVKNVVKTVGLWSHIKRKVKPCCSVTCGFCGCCPLYWNAVAMGLLQRKGASYFYRCVCCDRTAVQSRASETGVEGDFLLAVGQVWAGQRASQHAWLEGPFWSPTFETRSHSHWVLSVTADLMRRRCECWVDVCVFIFARPYKVSGTWAFSWVTARSSGWRLFIPSSYAAWPLSKTSWTSWLT